MLQSQKGSSSPKFTKAGAGMPGKGKRLTADQRLGSPAACNMTKQAHITKSRLALQELHSMAGSALLMGLQRRSKPRQSDHACCSALRAFCAWVPWWRGCQAGHSRPALLLSCYAGLQPRWAAILLSN